MFPTCPGWTGWKHVPQSTAGGTTLIRLAAGYVHPTTGRVDVLGHTLGRVDVRHLRTGIGLASGALAAMLRPGLTAVGAVMAGKHAALETWWHSYDDSDAQRARSLLARMGCGPLAEQPLGTLSDGERQRVQLARTLMTDPALLLLDEPTAGLDLGGREDLVARLAELAADPVSPPTVLVTHHVEEIPPGFDHALVLADGGVVAAGRLDDVLGDGALARAFGLPIVVERREGRTWARLG